MNPENIQLRPVDAPLVYKDVAPVFLTTETMVERKNKITSRMKAEGFDALVIYADKEHGGNFEYLTGFIPRFEEGLLVITSSGDATLILGNENLKMVNHSRLPAELKHCPHFSLPNQPMDNEKDLGVLFKEVSLHTMSKVGLVGWKMFTTRHADNKKLFDVPFFIVDSLNKILHPNAVLENAADIFIGGNAGARIQNNENEIAHYEYGANLASNCILSALDAVEVGVREVELGALLAAEGQYQTVVSIAATGQRFEYANFYPTYKKVELGKPLSLTTGFKGGLSSRTAFVVNDESELPSEQADYLERMAKPYFGAVATWLKNIKVGMTGHELYNIVEEAFPKAQYGWHLNPGHLSADEEWMSSPIYNNSTETLKSGMILQIDIIPSVQGYAGVSAEESIAIADESLKLLIKNAYPELWDRIVARRHYLENILNLELSEDVIPLSNAVAYMRPYMLNKQLALTL